MASRLYKSAIGVTRVRHTSFRPLASTPIVALQSTRNQSSVPDDPKKTAQSLIDALPGNSLASKAAILSAGTGIAITAISNEIYVLNEESVTAFSLILVYWAIAHYGSPLYNEWAEVQTKKMNGILHQARKDHTTRVQDRIEDVQRLGGVIDITKSLFEVSKETAQLEAKAYELQQKTTVASRAKAVLDSWVRYEAQVKNRQQKELAETVINKIDKELENPRVLKQILDQSVAEIERTVSVKHT